MIHHKRTPKPKLDKPEPKILQRKKFCPVCVRSRTGRHKKHKIYNQEINME